MPPLDNPFSGNRYFYSRAQWKLSFAWLPHRCNLSSKIIWLQFGYIGEAKWHGTSDGAVEYYWHTPTEHLIWQLKQRDA